MTDPLASMLKAARIPPDPIGSPEKLRYDLIEQILAFQMRYEFDGEQHTSESLQKRKTRNLERLCDFMLMGIANSLVNDKLLKGWYRELS